MRLEDLNSTQMEALAKQLAYQPFSKFVASVSPQYGLPPPHLRKFYRRIEESVRKPVFLVVSIPPRHGKSETAAHAMAHRMRYLPACHNIYTTYGKSLSLSMARKIKRLYERSGGHQLKSKMVTDMVTAMGGGMLATSSGGAVTGRGVNGGIIFSDDMIKGIKQARSRLARDTAHDYLVADLLSRGEAGFSFVVIGTRWHDDDPIGRLMKNPLGMPLEFISMPAVADPHGKPYFNERANPEGAVPLWHGIDKSNPTREGALAWYARIRARSETFYKILYQGLTEQSGNEMFRGQPAVYSLANFAWDGHRGCICIDPAATIKTSSDNFAIGVLAAKDYDEKMTMKLLSMTARKMTVPEGVDVAIGLQERLGFPIVVESVGGFSAFAQFARRIRPNINIVEIHPKGDKRFRATPLQDAWMSGRFMVPMGVANQEHEWVNDFIAECNDFTGQEGGKDDQVDVASTAWNWFQMDAGAQLSTPVDIIGAGSSSWSEFFSVKNSSAGREQSLDVDGLLGSIVSGVRYE